MSDQPITPEHSDVSRRSFLARAAGVAAASGALAGCAFDDSSIPLGAGAYGKSPAPPEGGSTIRMGVIGTGGMGTAHCHSFMRLVKEGKEDAQIVALADVCEPRLANAWQVCKDNQGIEVAQYRDYRDLLARDDIHAVLIASPEHWHSKHAVDAIMAGKDVYLEKPMTLRLREAIELRRAVRANPDKIFQVGTQMIMLPKYSEARKVIAEGGIGKPVWSQTSYCRNTPSGEWNYYAIDNSWEPGVNLNWDEWCAPVGKRPWNPYVYARWRRYKDFSTGVVGDLLVHQMTPLVLALESEGWPTRVSAIGGHYIDKDMENHDQVNLTVQFEGGHTLVVAGSTNNEAGLETMIRGQKANIYLGGRHCVVRPERVFADEIEPYEIECPDIGNDQDQLRLDWLRCIRERSTPASGVDLGTKIMVIVDLATRAMWTGKSQEFDPDRMLARTA